MKFCTKCGAQLADDAAFCTNCGTSFAAEGAQAGPAPEQAQPQQAQGQPQYQQAPYQQYQQPYVAPAPVIPPYDHTAEFDAKDISDNKVIAMCVYLLSTVGVIIALLASHDSKYAAFHVRQGLKMTVLTILIALVSGILCWTVIVPIAGGVCAVIIFVLRIICFFQVCSGKAVEPAIIRSLGFLK